MQLTQYFPHAGMKWTKKKNDGNNLTNFDPVEHVSVFSRTDLEERHLVEPGDRKEVKI